MLLHGKYEGYFIVHRSVTPDCYGEITVLSGGKPHTKRIMSTPQGMQLEGSHVRKSSLWHLIEHYRSDPGFDLPCLLAPEQSLEE